MHAQEPLITPNTTRRIAAMAAGDFAMFIVFSAVGTRSHGGAVDLASIGHVMETALPFAACWAVAATLVGAYRSDVLDNRKALLGRTVLAWALAVLPAIGLRALVRQSAFPAYSFIITSFLFVSLFVGAWRLLFSWLVNRGEHNAN